MAKYYKRTTTGPKNGTRTTITRSSDGSIRTTISSGPKWARYSQSFKDGRVRSTRSSTIPGFGTSRTSSLSPLINPFKKIRRSRSRPKNDVSGKKVWLIVLFVLSLVYVGGSLWWISLLLLMLILFS